MENNKKTVVYARISSDTQSFDLQLEAAKPFLKGIREEDIVIITELAASKSSLPEGLQKLLKLVKNNQVDTLIVYQRDRLTRSLDRYLELIDLIYTHNVKVIFTANQHLPFQQNQESGVIKEVLYAMLQEKERNHMSNRIKGALKAKQS